GDSRLPIPDVAVEALREAAGDPALQGYAFQRGLPAHRESIAGWMGRRCGESLDPWTEVLPVIGSKEAIALTAFALLDPGDTVLIPDPGYAPYFEGVLFAGGREIGLEFHSFSKTYNMTGWRLGWVAGNARLIADLRRVKTFFDTGSYLGIQAAGAAVLAEADRFIERTVTALRDRRDAAVQAFRGAGFELEAPLATLYLWLEVPGGDSARWCRELLEREALVLMPGAALGSGGEGFARAPLTVSPERYAEVAARLTATA
ncbi:MAG: aminotransferase class I/II-fold pyridoxal phosphate-dependent enzyme, partial [Gemmatimonadales bacterium]